MSATLELNALNVVCNPIEAELLAASENVMAEIIALTMNNVPFSTIEWEYGAGFPIDVDGKRVPKTNEECAVWRDSLAIPFRFDVRESLVEQAADLFGELSERFATLQALVKDITDKRDLDVINRIVSDPSFVSGLYESGRAIGHGGAIMTEAERFQQELASRTSGPTIYQWVE